MSGGYQTPKDLLDALALACGNPDWNPKKTAFNCSCPAHNDGKTKSLKFEIVPSKKYGGETVAAKCFAGCSAEDVNAALARLGLDFWRERAAMKGGRSSGRPGSSGNPFAQFRPPKKRAEKPHSGAFVPTTLADSKHKPDRFAWMYRNFSGHTAYAVRMPAEGVNPETGKPNKRISQHPAGVAGPWLPLFSAWPLDPGKPLVICEGEPALEALAAAGSQAMTFKGGVSLKGSLKRMIAPLVASVGRDAELAAVLWPDAAADGIAYMDAAARHLLMLSGSRWRVGMVDVRDFKPKSDAADFPPEKIREIVSAAQPFGGGEIVWLGEDDWHSQPGDETALMLSAEAYYAAEEAGLLSGDQLDTTRMSDAEAVDAALAVLGIEVRLDARAEVIQYRGRNLMAGLHTHGAQPVDPNGWRNPDAQMREAVIASIQARCVKTVQIESNLGGEKKYSTQAKKRIVSPASFDRAINLITHLRRVDPFRQWLEELPEWDFQPRLESLLFDLFVCPPDAAGDTPLNALYRWASRSWFVTAVARTYSPGCKQDAHPVLCGDQGIGKSTVVRWSLPQEFDGWFTDSLNLDDKNKEQIESLEGGGDRRNTGIRGERSETDRNHKSVFCRGRNSRSGKPTRDRRNSRKGRIPWSSPRIPGRRCRTTQPATEDSS